MLRKADVMQALKAAGDEAHFSVHVRPQPPPPRGYACPNAIGSRPYVAAGSARARPRRSSGCWRRTCGLGQTPWNGRGRTRPAGSTL